MARKRRGRAEGSVYQRADGQWVAAVSLGYGADGRRRRPTVYGPTKQAVLDKLDAVRRDVGRGLAVDGARLSVGQFLDYWLETDVRPNRAPGTYRSYALTVRLHIVPHIGRTNLARLTADHVAGLYASLARAGVPARTRELVHCVLRRALRRAVDWRKIGWNPCTAVERPKAPKADRSVATPDQARALLRAASGQRLEALFVLAVTTGMRQGELFALRWQDIDLASKQVRVRHSLEELDGKHRLKEPKSRTSRRTIDLPASAVEALAGHRRRMLAEGHSGATQSVFCDSRGGWLRKSNFVRNDYAAILKRAKISGIPFHGWRHFNASYQVELGTNVKVLQERLGHADVATTMRFYVHTRAESHREAAEAFDSAFGKVKPPRPARKRTGAG